MDWNEAMRDIKRDLKELRPAIAEVNGSFNELAKHATKPGALDTKTKELIAVAIGVAKQCNECIGFHMKAAIMAGATREEVSETLGMCVYMGGGPSLMYAGKALAAYDQFTAK